LRAESQLHPVLELMNSRRASASQPGQRSDEARLGLAIEGGGMRGVVSAGMVLALEQLNMLDVFDAVYGSSAGSINGAFFLARQAAFGTTIYYQDINNNKFINLARFLTGEPVMSLEFLLRDIMINVKPLNTGAVLASPIPLHVLMSSTSRCELVDVSEFQDGDDLLLALNASTRIPIIAGPPIDFRGEPYLDASLFSSIPVDTAIADGCTHVLALLTRPAGSLPSRPGLVDRYFASPLLGRISPELGRIPLARPAQYRRTVEFILEHMAAPAAPPYVACAQVPASQPAVSRMEKRRARLYAGAVGGCRTVLELLGAELAPVEVIQLFDSAGTALPR